jgi:hypothetical protein
VYDDNWTSEEGSRNDWGPKGMEPNWSKPPTAAVGEVVEVPMAGGVLAVGAGISAAAEFTELLAAAVENSP